MDLNSINQSVLRLINNSTNIISFLKDFTTGGAKDVSISYIEADGNTTNKTFPNIAKFTGSVESTIKNEMYRTVYVDEINGDDSNSGSSSSPIKSVHKAVNFVPMGGRVTIVLLSDCNWSGDAVSYNKVIEIRLNGHALNLVKYADSNNKYLLYSIIGYANTVFFYGNNLDGSKVVLPVLADGEKIFSPDHSVFIKSIGSAEPELSQVTFGYKADIEDNGAFYISSATASASSFSFSGGQLIQSNGSSRALTDLVSGVVKDSNGVPRNIQSNLIF